MKRLALVFLAAALCLHAAAAQDSGKQSKDESKWASISYFNVPVYKILESKQAYVIIYGKNKVGVGNTTIPKKWAKGNVENPRKLKFRNVKGALKPFMTVVSKDGEFKRVVLNVPTSKLDPVWGIAAESKVNDADKDTLEELDL